MKQALPNKMWQNVWLIKDKKTHSFFFFKYALLYVISFKMLQQIHQMVFFY